MRARGDRLPHRCRPGLRRHDEDSTLRGSAQDLGDRLVAALARQQQVDHDDVRLEDARSRDRLLGGSGFADGRDSVFLLEPQAQRGAEDRVVVDQEDADHGSAPAATITARVPRTARGLQLEHAAAPFDEATAQAQPQLSSGGVAVGRGQADAVVVDDEHALISASESRDVNPLRAGRDRVRKQVAENETERVRGDRELAGGAGDDFGATISEVGDRLLHAVGYSRYAGRGLIRAHRLEDRVDELERARQLPRADPRRGGR